MARSSSDDAVERLLRRSLSARGAAGGDVCPDPDLLAAFADGGLSRSDAVQIERHASSCARCTEILAIVLQSEPAPAIESAGAIASAWRTWRWAIPMATAATVAGLWFVSDRRDGLGDNASPPSAMMQASEPSRQVSQEQPQSPAAPQASPVDARRKAASDELEQQPAGNSERQQVDSTERPRGDSTERQRVEGTERQRVEGTARQPAESSALQRAERDFAKPAPPIAAEKSAASQLRETEARVADSASQKELTAKAEEASILTGAPAPRPSAETASATRPAIRSQTRLDGAANLLVPSPDPNTLWRAMGTTIQRSTDRGTSWTDEYDAKRPIAGGAAASREEAWLFGRAGLLLRRTTAGWSPVRPPSDADVVSMEVASANAATVTLSDGRVFATVNGGASWMPR